MAGAPIFIKDDENNASLIGVHYDGPGRAASGPKGSYDRGCLFGEALIDFIEDAKKIFETN